MKLISTLVPAGLAVVSCVLTATADTYRVGLGEKYARVSDVAERVLPGDVVEVTGDISESVLLTRSGRRDKPITLRGLTRVENGNVIRPKVSVPKDAKYGIMVNGDWNVIEGLDVGGAVGSKFESGSAITYNGDHLTVRNCCLHHSKQGIHCPYDGKGNLIVEFCEFDSVGGVTDYGANMHGIHILSTNPGATVTVRFSYLHDGAGYDSVMIKSRAFRNVLAYSWLESPYNGCVRIIDTNVESEVRDKLYPAHTDIVGNVFFQGWSPGSDWSILSLGGEDAGAAGTEGDFNIAHNAFVATRHSVDPSVSLFIRGNVDHVRAYNNVFLAYGIPKHKAYERQAPWDSPRTQAFVERRGNGEPLVEESNNWLSERCISVPELFTNALRGLNPGFVDLLNYDFRPRKDSPLAGAGMWPLPSGAVIDLAPEYEPQRGIPIDLEPKPRRKVTPPSIGPFEVPEPAGPGVEGPGR